MFVVCVVIFVVLVLATLAFADKKYPKYGVVNPDVAKYCKDCGTKLPVKKKPAAPRGMTYIGKNSKGYKEYTWNKDRSVMILVPAGEFWMGSPLGEGYDDERPKHKVYLDTYYIDKYEVTNAQYRKFCDATGRVYPEDPGWSGMDDYISNYPSYPVVNVSWNDAAAYAAWAGKRLPTETEWEKAARGVDGRKYPWGNKEPDAGGFYRCNYCNYEDGYRCAAPVGTYERGVSPYGLHDMAGNVWEWCYDRYDKYYYGRSPARNPRGPDSGRSRVVRGGSWDIYAFNVRCANRNSLDASSSRYASGGFRCAFSP